MTFNVQKAFKVLAYIGEKSFLKIVDKVMWFYRRNKEATKSTSFFLTAQNTEVSVLTSKLSIL